MKLSHRIVSSAVPLVTLFGISELVELGNLFNKYPLIDIPFHTIGGILTARGIDIMTVSRMKTRWIIGGVTIVGILWEVYEYNIGVSGSGLTLESFKDIIVDIAGAYLYCFYRDEKKMMIE